jgi:2,4-dienoyl-CoA reductase-like NADH-dependent reductase (Old Yellow Enzyme family)
LCTARSRKSESNSRTRGGRPVLLLVEDIKDVVRGFRDAARRAVKAGVDGIEIHAPNEYLLCSFRSPLSNRRTDAYGGRNENRTRALMETVKAVREVIPANMPLLLRVSATEVDGWASGWELGCAPDDYAGEDVAGPRG